MKEEFDDPTTDDHFTSYAEVDTDGGTVNLSTGVNDGAPGGVAWLSPAVARRVADALNRAADELEPLAHTGRPSRLPFRAAFVSASVATVAALAVTLTTSADDAPDAWPTMGTVPVVTEGTSSPSPYRPEPRPTPHTTRAGERLTLKPTPSPTERVAKPKATPPTKHPIAKPPADIRISFYRNCTGFAQSCIDDGHLTMYGGRILAGHNYMGYQWLSRVDVGRIVRVIDGPLAGTYRVYGHMRINRQGGAIPDFGGAALVLQSCEGSGTGFSLLKRIK